MEQLNISDQVFTYIPFMNFQIKIYQELNVTKPKKYFCSPLCLLDRNSVQSCFNQVSKQAEIRFNVAFSNQDLKIQIIKYLKDQVGEDVKESQLQVNFYNVICRNIPKSYISQDR